MNKLRFSLSSLNSWRIIDEDFDYEQFYRNIMTFFEDVHTAQDKAAISKLLLWWNRHVPFMFCFQVAHSSHLTGPFLPGSMRPNIVPKLPRRSQWPWHWGGVMMGRLPIVLQQSEDVLYFYCFSIVWKLVTFIDEWIMFDFPTFGATPGSFWTRRWFSSWYPWNQCFLWAQIPAFRDLSASCHQMIILDQTMFLLHSFSGDIKMTSIFQVYHNLGL